MAEVDVAAELAKLQGTYENTKAKQKPTDGNYISTISEMKVVKSTSGKLQVRVKFIILDEGDFFEAPEYAYYTISEEEGLAYFKGFCAVIGCELPASFVDVPPALNDFAAQFKGKVKITVKTNKDQFRNIYCNGLHEDAA